MRSLTLPMCYRLGSLLLRSLTFRSCIARHQAGIASSSAPVTQTYTVIGPVEETD